MVGKIKNFNNMYNVGERIEYEFLGEWHDSTIKWVGGWGVIAEPCINIYDDGKSSYIPFECMRRKDSKVLNLEVDPYGEEYW